MQGNTQKTCGFSERTQIFSALFSYRGVFKENTDMIKPSINDLLKRDDFTELHENSGNADRGNIDKSGHCYHVITRAWGKENIFTREIAQYRHDLLRSLCSAKGVVILFSVTMPNHSHDVLLTPDWSVLPEILCNLNMNVSKKVREKRREDGKEREGKPVFRSCPSYAIVNDMVYLFYLGKYIFDNPEQLAEEKRFVPYSCFWMFKKGYFKEPYDPNMYVRLFGMTAMELYEIYSTMSAREVRKFAKERFKDWTEDDNKRIFHNADAG